MEIKPKPCIGTGKAKGYGCGLRTKYRKYGLGVNCCYASWLYSNDGFSTLSKSIIGAKKKVVKEQKAKDKMAKIENKSIAVLIIEARTPFQKLIRIRDHRKNCICCDEILPYDIGRYDAGHYYKAELYTGLIFHPYNVHGQRVYCNQHLHGNEAAYTYGLKRRIGEINYHILLSLSNRLKSYKWDRYELIELKKHYTKELKEVDSGIKNINDVDFSVGIKSILYL
jgi:hypothetical protein